MWFTFAVIAWAVAQFVIGFGSLVIDAREGLCADARLAYDDDVVLRSFDASANAARSNFLPSAIFTVITTMLPYVVLYVVPFVLVALRKNTDSALRDGIISWLALTFNSVLKQIIRKPRPDAYAACISTSTSYGMPSGHSMWAAALWVYALMKGDESWVGGLHGKGVYWAVLLWVVAIPLTRYELQYHTVWQILLGVALGTLIGWLGSKINYDRLKMVRLQAFFIWLITSSLAEWKFSPAKKIPPLLVELAVFCAVLANESDKCRKNNYTQVPNEEEPDKEGDFIPEKDKILEKDAIAAIAF